MIKTLDDLRAEEARLKQELAGIHGQINAKLKETLVACSKDSYGNGCGMAAKIGELTYIQTYWYESPHGCTGGDHWHAGDGEWKCTHCSKLNRLYDKPEIQKLKHLFKDVVDEDKRG